MEYYSSADEEQDLADWLAGRSETGDGEVIDLPTGDEGEESA
jgi:hypothetical protein